MKMDSMSAKDKFEINRQAIFFQQLAHNLNWVWAESPPTLLKPFSGRRVDAQIEFAKDQNGAVSSLTLHQGGRDMKGARK